MDASTDLNCNSLLTRLAETPVQMVEAIHDAVPDDEVREGCKQFHCGVLQNALGDMSDLSSSSGVCTNVYGTKTSADETACMCQGLIQEAETAYLAIQSVC